jgi:hypothetical protein
MHAKTALALASLAITALVSSAGARISFTVKDGEVADWVRDRVKALQPTPEEKRFDSIGWAKSILEAEQLARRNNRPVFLFTHDGRIATGRC